MEGKRTSWPVFKTNWFQLTLTKLAVSAKLVLRSKQNGKFIFMGMGVIQSKPFFKEFRVVGQICHEDMNESGILPKGVQGAKSPEAPAILQYTVPKNVPPENYFLGRF